MPKTIINIDKDDYTQEEVRTGEIWRYLDLSGEHLGARVEDTPPGGTSSFHHYHTLEEEHVLVLAGSATLHFGDEQVPLSPGDHVWFKAGEEIPHHIENTSTDLFRFLVFGERKKGDVVFYPDREIAMVKALGFKRINYKERKSDV